MPRDVRVTAALAGVASLVSAAVVATTGHGIAEWVFITACLSAVGLALAALRTGWHEAVAQQRRARVLAGRVPDQVAREAVRAERERLSRDISAALRAWLARIADDAGRARSDADPRPAADRIHAGARAAHADLRRQLGLLHDPPARRVDAGAPGQTWSRADLALAALAALLALVESLVYPRVEGVPSTLLGVLLTVAAAACLALRRTAPATAAVLLAALWLLGWALAAPVTGGLWFLLTVCPVLWTCLVGPARDVAAGLLLLAAVSWAQARTDLENLGAVVVAVAVTALVAVATRGVHARGRRLRARGDAREAELRAASEQAVAAARLSYARDAHDLVSHAVGVIAVQAAAASVAPSSDLGRARAALEVVRRTALEAVGALDDTAPADRTQRDVAALLDRFRAAGLPVRVQGVALLGEVVDEVAFRCVQESLTNVLHHAPGARATLDVHREGDEVVIRVADDGPGPGAVVHGFGLVGLSERLAEAGGSLEVDGGATGFVVRARLPVGGRVRR